MLNSLYWIDICFTINCNAYLYINNLFIWSTLYNYEIFIFVSPANEGF